MAQTPAEIDSMADYTNAQMVKLLRWSVAELASNPETEVKIGNRTYQYRDMAQLQAMLQHFEELAAADLDEESGSTCPVVRFQEANP